MPKRSKPQYVYTYRSVRREGKKEGRDWRWKFWPPKWPFREAKEPIPPLDQSEPTQYEVNLKEVSEADMQIIADDWGEEDRKLKPDYCRARTEYKNAEKSFAKESAEANIARQIFNTINEKFSDIPHPSLHPKIMLMFLILIAIFEYPLNSLIFQIFGQGKAETYVMAGVIAGGVPFAAHFMGKRLKQEMKSRTDIWLLILTPMSIIALLAVVSYLRSIFLEVEDVVTMIGVEMSFSTSNILFLVINMAVFFIAMIISYEGSYSNDVKYKDLRKRYTDTLKSLRKESGEEVAAARRLAKAEDMYQQARQKRQKIYEKYKEDAILVQQHVESFITLYRNANMQSRRIAAMPESFKKPPFEAKLPEIFLKPLDWDCEDINFREGNT